MVFQSIFTRRAVVWPDTIVTLSDFLVEPFFRPTPCVPGGRAARTTGEGPRLRPPAVTLSLQGNQLTIRPAITLVGTFTIRVTASDGRASDVKTFTVTVNNTGPTLGPIAAQTMAAGRMP